MSLLRAIFKITVFIILTLVLVPLQLFYALIQRMFGIKPVRQSPIVIIWYQGMTWLFSLRVRYEGIALQPRQQYLYVSNHTSYLDIMVLGGLIPAFFVAKADIAGWPIMGFLAKLGGTTFISRKRSLVKQQMELFKSQLIKGEHMLLFPEGTTSNGREVLPFKSSLLNVLYNDGMPDIQVVPVCIHYTAINGKPCPDNKDAVAWYADMELAPHLWDVLKLKSIDVVVHMTQPVQTNSYTDAKKLTAQCEAVIRESFAIDDL